jgi:hypothetical protein
MTQGHEHYATAYRAAERAQHLLAQPATLDAYDWGLVATLIVEADNALTRARQQDQSLALPLLDLVLEELRDVSGNFTSAAFLRATRPERRQNPSLFAPRP